MKHIFFLTFYTISTLTILAQKQIIVDSIETKIASTDNVKNATLTANFKFTITNTGVNSKQHEYGSGFFKQKYIIISARKIGQLGGKKDPLTREPHTQIYCATIKKTGDLDRALLYSRVLNTDDNEGSITFTADQRTIYFTRDLR